MTQKQLRVPADKFVRCWNSCDFQTEAKEKMGYGSIMSLTNRARYLRRHGYKLKELIRSNTSSFKRAGHWEHLKEFALTFSGAKDAFRPSPRFRRGRRRK